MKLGNLNSLINDLAGNRMPFLKCHLSDLFHGGNFISSYFSEICTLNCIKLPTLCDNLVYFLFRYVTQKVCTNIL